MATLDDLRRIASSLPETTGDETGSSYSVAGKAISWTWMERVEPKKAILVRLPAIDVATLETVITDAWRCRAPARLRSKLDPS
jgi:hypothetical protein